jgi:uncharacterized protein YndB with AHSA1/START domain
MRNVSIDRKLAAPKSAVWAVLADYPNISEWNSGVKASVSTGGGTEGVGAKRHCDLSPAGSLEETVVAWEPEQKLVISIDSTKKLPIKNGEATFVMDNDGDATAFSLSYDYHAKGGPAAGLLEKLMHGQLKKGFNGFIDDLETAAKAKS